MSKRTCVLTVIISSILFLVTFFAVFYSNTVLADKTASIAFYKDSSGSFCFLPEKGTNLDEWDNVYNRAHLYRYGTENSDDEESYYFNCWSGNNKYKYYGNYGNYSYGKLKDVPSTYEIKYFWYGSSDEGEGVPVKVVNLDELFDQISVEYSNGVFSADISPVLKYAGFSDKIEVKNIDSSKYSLKNGKKLEIEKDYIIGTNSFEVIFKDNNNNEIYKWNMKKYFEPSISSVTLDGKDTSSGSLGISNGDHEFSVAVSPENGIKYVKLTVTDINNGNVLCDSMELTHSSGTYIGKFNVSNVPVDHKLSYKLVIKNTNEEKFTFIDGTDSGSSDGSYSFFIKANNSLDALEIRTNRNPDANAGRAGDSFIILFKSNTAIKSISSDIEGIELTDSKPVVIPTNQNPETWYRNGSTYTYQGTITDVDSLRYLRISYLYITFEDGTTDYYDNLSFIDKAPVIYPAFSAHVERYSGVDDGNTLSKDGKFDARLYFDNYSIDSNCKVSPTYTITNFSKTETGFDPHWATPVTSAISSLDGNYHATATIQIRDIEGFCMEENEIDFYMEISDPAGQTCVVKVDTDYIFYGPFTVSSAVLTTSNPITFTDSKTKVTYHYANKNDTLKLTFNSNHALSSCTVYVDETGYHFDKNSIKAEGGGAYSVQLNKINFESGKPIRFSHVLLTDKSSQTADILENNINFNNIIYMGDYDVLYNAQDFDKENPRYLTSQGVIDFELTPEDADREIKLKELKMTYSNPYGQSNTVSIPVDTNATFSKTITTKVSMQIILAEKEKYDYFYFDELALSFYITVVDRSGLESEIEINPSYCHYFKTLEECVDYIKIETPDDRTYVRNGDLLKFKFSSSHALSDSEHKNKYGYYMLNGTLNGEDIVYYSQDQYNWEARYTILDDNEWIDNGELKLTAELFDKAQQEPYTLTITDRNVYYYAPISISDLEFISNNTNNGRLANDYDKVTISFKSSHMLSNNNCLIANKMADLKCQEGEGYFAYEASCNIRDLKIDDNTDIIFFLGLFDDAGNVAYYRNDENTPNVRYQAPIEAHDYKAQSNNVNGYLITKNGNDINISFNTTHPTKIVSATIADKELSLTSTNNDKMHWTATYTVTDNIVPDLNMIDIKIKIGDDSGNDNIDIGSNDIMYYAPLTVSAVSITTDNSKDSSKYAVDGNKVTVSFTTNHKIHTPACSFELISEKNMAVAEDALTNGSYRYTYSRKISNGEVNDQAGLTFAFSVTDIADNARVDVNENSAVTNNHITYYSPLAINTSIASNGANASYAKNGDVITIKATANHAVQVVSASALDKNMTVAGNDTASVTLTYVISATEKELKEGAVNTSVSFTDAAGNTFSSDKTNSGSVIYDRTKPSVKVGNAFSGFSASDISFNISIEDANIDKSKTGVEVNGNNNTIGDGLEENGTVYTMTVKNEEEGNITVVISAVDLAGNAATQEKYSVTVDKTNPKITTTTLFSSSNKIYKPGLVIADLFDIEEDNMQEISCTVSDGSSVTDWDVNAPLDTDGKKTISLIAVDKAGNASEQLVLDVFIDGTAPNPILKDTITYKTLSAGLNEFDKSAIVSFELQDLSYNPDSPDKFTTLKIVNPDGTTVDLLADGASDSGKYTYEFKNIGTYEVIVEATDDLGNTTGEIRYELKLTESFIDAVGRFFTDENSESGVNVPRLVIASCCAVVFFVALAFVIVHAIKRKRR